MRKTLKSGYIGLVVGFIILLLLNRSIWLEMRVTTELVLPLCTIAGLWLFLNSGKTIRPGLFVALQVLAVLGFLIFYEFDIRVLGLMPAVWVRQGFYLHFLSVGVINLLLAGVVMIVNATLIKSEKTVS